MYVRYILYRTVLVQVRCHTVMHHSLTIRRHSASKRSLIEIGQTYHNCTYSILQYVELPKALKSVLETAPQIRYANWKKAHADGARRRILFRLLFLLSTRKVTTKNPPRIKERERERHTAKLAIQH